MAGERNSSVVAIYLSWFPGQGLDLLDPLIVPKIEEYSQFTWSRKKASTFCCNSFLSLTDIDSHFYNKT
jgi:hypothetical protein